MNFSGKEFQLINGDSTEKVCTATKHYLEILTLAQLKWESLQLIAVLGEKLDFVFNTIIGDDLALGADETALKLNLQLADALLRSCKGNADELRTALVRIPTGVFEAVKQKLLSKFFNVLV